MIRIIKVQAALPPTLAICLSRYTATLHIAEPRNYTVLFLFSQPSVFQWLSFPNQVACLLKTSETSISVLANFLRRFGALRARPWPQQPAADRKQSSQTISRQPPATAAHGAREVIETIYIDQSITSSEVIIRSIKIPQ